MKLLDVVTTALVALALAAFGSSIQPPSDAPVSSTSTSASASASTSVESVGALRAPMLVQAGERVSARGRVPASFARSRVTLLRRDAGKLAKVGSGRANNRGRYALTSTAPAAPGTYSHEVRVTRAGRTRTVKRFVVEVVAPTTTTPDPSPVPPTPTGPLGNPDDWTYLGGERVARWDPCTTITWSMAGTSPYAAAQADVETALTRIAAATGLVFTQVADPELSALDITWTSASIDSRLAGTTVGLGGFSSYPQPVGPSKIESAYVLLDQEHNLPAGFSTVGSSWGKAMLHEITHAVGLGHAAGPEQIMYPKVVSTPAELGAGDLTGLAAVGASQGCFALPVLGRATAPARTHTYVD